MFGPLPAQSAPESVDAVRRLGGMDRAGHELAALLKHLSTLPDAAMIIGDVAARLAASYRASDASTRNRIETGTLEHALESLLVRPFFSNWSHDPVLREAYGPALEWAVSE